MNTKKKIGVAAATLAGAGLLGFGALAGSNAFAESAPTTPTTSASTSSTTGDNQSSTQSDRGPGGQSNDTVVTGDEATRVTAAVTAKDSAFKVEQVRKDPDGSYDVIGTSNATHKFYEVSADLATITENAGGPGNGQPPGGQQAPTDQQAPADSSTAPTTQPTTGG